MKKANESLLKISERWLLVGWAGGPPGERVLMKAKHQGESVLQKPGGPSTRQRGHHLDLCTSNINVFFLSVLT